MMAANTNTAGTPTQATGETTDYVTVLLGDELFGLPIDRVHDVFIATNLTDVPLSPPEIKGLLNLRGRVVTALCLRRRLGLPDRTGDGRNMAVGLEHGGEAYGLLVDQVGEVMKLANDTYEPNPVHLDTRWRAVSRGVHRLDGRLLIILDVEAVLAFGDERPAATAA
ncbi:chemotaxis protein CheW [Methylobacterium indicum]|uniref:Chemotaxis protein CheW n=1 Tax=Methylobacterium indicum TaxID=1775910 RepID=A0ABR5H2Y6_9HYPH|nr:chemotaxis protein CheW [Methylobacterium indicum]KMO14376.1 chemotaxis protein CheW [Methylobacterium indicum]KMO17820.1 chemotaxis protein CheW [Methylobacterium indicum]KTS36872.1 chemotaxis protein CheW [Methylobacterium indicum]KTS39797.1 chemotaxis protein CheW [Methylobacterium indicum]KTS49526.1 chemotaxis protein CheW [Methylobacterium indicum]